MRPMTSVTVTEQANGASGRKLNSEDMVLVTKFMGVLAFRLSSVGLRSRVDRRRAHLLGGSLVAFPVPSRRALGEMKPAVWLR